MECADGDGALSQRMFCVLSYAGSKDDIAINYTLLAISICAAYFLLEKFSNNLSSSVSRGYRSDAFVAFLGVIVFQIGLCLILGCSGVSIIWASILGWMLNETGEFSFVHNANATASKPAIVVLAMILNGSAIVYYAIYFPIVTTVAHILAVLLGAAISLRMMRRRACREEQLGLLAVEERESNDSKEVEQKFSGNGAS
uniref:Transmembrane protein n=2 Tax=Leptocylindrus danicus TaxID=163516 RepID=A0A7S2KXG2_9STRA|mmetsp:Transcript_27649/g.40791  ORF Transcript_27649/g.40791 Transcript_27649/m.40791 type:complete len:199 (+) Transcript_27649:473-1069(+)|eukprot:CAMPEP_0116047320 /NCGR_PEP_ID=MMETSP0321-20121206/28800_1 /TAXON_ID=163516 /ORGANISM="Leptocylindrus danicus var. danicus, Strain B650" /LENGTH=198 /DNA_ID=CAMNT_0003529135 /DNA_START=300 /DNA_END=896 /DNA_ORIENTATION=+